MKPIPHPGTNEIIRHLTRFAGPRKWSFIGSCTLGLLTGLADTIGVTAIVYLLFSVVSGKAQVTGDGILESLFALLDTVSQAGPLAIGLLVVAIILIRGAGNLAYMQVARSISLDAERSIRNALLDRYLSADIDEFVKKDTGHIINSIQIEATHVANFLYVASRLVIAASYLAVVFLVILSTAWLVAATIIAGAVVHGLLLRYMNARARSTGQKVLRHREDMASHAASAIRAFKSIKVSAAEGQAVQKLDDLSQHYSRSMFRLGKIEVLSATLAELVLLGLLGMILIVATVAGLHTATIIGVVALIWKARPSLGELEGSLLDININLASLRSVKSELAMAETREPQGSSSKPADLLCEPGPIEFSNVGFRYAGAGDDALHDVSFSIPRGSTCAILGKSGAGKTTLVNLLLKLASPATGRITVAGIDLQDIDRDHWLSVAGAAGQDLELTDGSLRANLALGLQDVDDSAILNALRIAEAIDVVSSDPDGLDATLGTSGMSLSGGQRQRMVLARALLRRPDVLVLDESTNSVDSATETRILANIRAAFPDITLINISHRIGAAEHVDHFVELQNGRVTDSGPVNASAETGRSGWLDAAKDRIRARVAS